MELSDYLSITPCNCPHLWCDFFAGGIGEYGTSFKKDEIEEMLADFKENGPKVVAHLKSLVAQINESRQALTKSMSQPTPEYALKICIINQDGDEERFEIVPSVTEEQGNEAVLRMTRYYKNHLKAENQVIDGED